MANKWDSYNFAPGTVVSSNFLNEVVTEFKQTVSVKQYGAVGDGVTDDTSAIQAAIDAVSTAGGGKIVFHPGTYLTDGILIKSNVWLDVRTATIKKRIDGTGTNTNCVLRTVTYGYGNYSNIRISGGVFDQNGKKCSGHLISLLYVDNLVLDGVTVKHDDGGSAVSGWRVWAMNLGGRNIQVRGCKVLNGSEVFQDGIHIYHGQRISISDCYVESGDDAFPLGSEPTDTNFNANPDPIEHVTISNCTVKSNKGFAFKAYIQPSANAAVHISDVVVSNITGTAGVARSGGIWLHDNDGPSIGSSRINGITLENISLVCGSASHDEVNDLGVYADNVDDITIRDFRFTATDASTVTGSNGFVGIQAIDCTKIKIDGFVYDDIQNGYAIRFVTCRDVEVSGCRLIHGGGASPVMDVQDTLRFNIHDNIITDIKDGLSGVQLVSGTTNVGRICNNYFSHAAGATTGQAIGVISTANTDLTIVGNDFHLAVQSINFASFTGMARYLFDANKGAIAKLSRGQGTATVPNGATTVTVTHGVGLYPTNANQIRLTAVNSLGNATKFWVSSVPNTTQFVITVNTDPGATTAIIAWEIFTGIK